MILLLTFLAILLNTADPQTIKLNSRIAVKFNKGEQKTFVLPEIDTSAKDTELYLQAKLSDSFLNKFLQPRIHLMTLEQKSILTCNQAANKFYEICSIPTSRIQEPKNLKINILSMADAEIEILVYVGSEYKISIGDQVLLEADQYIDEQEQYQILLMQIPKSILTLEQLQVSLVQTTISPYNQSYQMTMMYVNYSSSYQTLRSSKSKQASKLTEPRRGLICTFNKTEISPGDFVLIKITFRDEFSRLRFHTSYSVKDSVIKQSVNVADINSYNSFQMIEYDMMFLRYENILHHIKEGEHLQLLIYHYSHPVTKVRLFADMLGQEQNTITFYPEKLAVNMTEPYYTLILQKKQVQKLFPSSQHSSRFQLSSMYIQITTQKHPSTFYIVLRLLQKDQVIEQEWPQVIFYLPEYNQQTITFKDKNNQSTNFLISGANYLFEDSIRINSTSVIVNNKQKYMIQVHDQLNYISNGFNNKGQKQLLVQRCTSLDKKGTLDCFDSSVNYLNQTFAQNKSQLTDDFIVVKVEHSLSSKFTTIYSFEYELSKCPILIYSAAQSVHKCYFNIFFYTPGPSSQQKSFSFTLHKQAQLMSLFAKINSSSQLLSYELPAKGQLFFYVDVEAPIGGIIESTDIFMTTYFGDCILYGSRSEKYPLKDFIDENRYQVGIRGTLEIAPYTDSDVQLTFFASVYCYEESSFDIHVVSDYKLDQTKLQNDYFLVEGYSQEITLMQNQSIQFKLKPLNVSKQTILKIDQLQGTLNYEIYTLSENSIKVTIPCSQTLNNQKSCQFRSQKNTTYLIDVQQSPEQKVSHFIITLESTNNCMYYPTNKPKFIELDSNEAVCTRFRITKYDDLQITLSMTDFEYITSNIDAYITFNNNPNKILVTNLMHFFNQRQIKQNCLRYQKQGVSFSQNSQHFIDCQIELVVQSRNSPNTVTLTQIIQFTNQESMLTNGLERLSKINGLSKFNFKKYYYYLEQSSDLKDYVKVSFYSENNKNLVLVAKIQNARTFQVDPHDYYPSYPQNENSHEFIIRLTEGQQNGHMYIPNKDISCESNIVISVKQYDRKLSECVLLISVFSLEEIQQEEQFFVYTLEVNQGSTHLQLGQSVNQVVQRGKNQFFKIQSDAQIQSMIQITSNDFTSNAENCFNAEVYPYKKESEISSKVKIGKNGKYLIKEGSDKALIIQISARLDLPVNSTCSYKLSYVLLENPVYELQESSVISIAFEQQQSQLNRKYSFFLYKHLEKYQNIQISNNKPQYDQLRVVTTFTGFSSHENFNLYATQIDSNGVQNIFSKYLASFKSKQSPRQKQSQMKEFLSQFSFNQSFNGKQFLNDNNQYGLSFWFQSKENSRPKLSQSQSQQLRYFLIAVQNRKISSSVQPYNDDRSKNNQEKIHLQIVRSNEQIIIQPDVSHTNQLTNPYLTSISQINATSQNYSCFINLKDADLLLSSTIYFNFELAYGKAKILISDPSDLIIYEKIVSQPSNFKEPINIAPMISEYKPTFTRVPDLSSKLRIKVMALSLEVLYSLKIQTIDRKTQVIHLKEKIPYIVDINQKNDSNEFIYESGKKTFAIDARPCTILDHQNETINLVISLINNQQTPKLNISEILPSIQITQFKWNKDPNQIHQKTYNISQLSIDKHTGFYSIKLSTIVNGKYSLKLSKFGNIGDGVKLSLSLLLLLNNSSLNFTSHQLIPLPIQSNNIRLLLFSSILSIPIITSSENFLLEISPCSVQSPRFYIGQQARILDQQSEFRRQNNTESIVLIQNQLIGLSSLIYFRQLAGPKVYLRLQQGYSMLAKRQKIEDSSHQFLLNIVQKPKHYYGEYFKFNEKQNNQLSYKISLTTLHIYYFHLRANATNIISSFGDSLVNKKLVYKVYVSSSLSVLAKRSQCNVVSFENQTQIPVLQVTAQEIWLSDLLQNEKPTNLNNQQNFKASLQLDFSSIIEKLGQNQKYYIRIKAFLKQDSSKSEKSNDATEFSSSSGRQEYFYEPIVVRNPAIQVQWEVSEVPVMWLFLIGFLGTFVLLVVIYKVCQGICRWRNYRNGQNRLIEVDSSSPKKATQLSSISKRQIIKPEIIVPGSSQHMIKDQEMDKTQKNQTVDVSQNKLNKFVL